MNERPITQRRPALLTALMILVVMTLAACGGGFASAPGNNVNLDETDSPAAGSPSEEPVGEPVEQPNEQPMAETGGEQELTVFAAASLTDAFTELADTFEAQNPGVTVVRNFGSSLQLATQIKEGAQADVFASANEAQMASVVENGRLDGASVTFVHNRLTLIVPAGNPGGVTSLAGLATEGISFVTAVPGVPVREYTNQIFEQMATDPTFGPQFVDAVYANLVSEEDSVRKVVTKIALGEADVGIVYRSDVTPDVADEIEQIEIPEEYNVIATYPIGLIADAPNPELGRAFIDFVLSEDGQAILEKWGFEPAAGG